jgi:hypothetical protein
MKVELNIADQDIIDVLVTALEGGSNYWYNLPDVTMARKHYKNVTSLAVSEKVIKAVLEHNEIIPVYDVEDEDNHLGDISQANIKRGLQLFMDDDRAWTPDMDAEQADVFFQYVVMGELVYG